MDVWGFVWLYCIVWWIIQDMAKVAVYQIMVEAAVGGDVSILLDGGIRRGTDVVKGLLWERLP